MRKEISGGLIDLQKPGQLGVTFEYHINEFNAVDNNNNWLVDHVVVRDPPEKAFMDPTMVGNIDGQYAAIEVSLFRKSAVPEEVGGKYNNVIFRTMQMCY